MGCGWVKLFRGLRSTHQITLKETHLSAHPAPLNPFPGTGTWSNTITCLICVCSCSRQQQQSRAKRATISRYLISITMGSLNGSSPNRPSHPNMAHCHTESKSHAYCIKYTGSYLYLQYCLNWHNSIHIT